jgi:hypothetical protein
MPVEARLRAPCEKVSKDWGSCPPFFLLFVGSSVTADRTRFIMFLRMRFWFAPNANLSIANERLSGKWLPPIDCTLLVGTIVESTLPKSFVDIGSNIQNTQLEKNALLYIIAFGLYLELLTAAHGAAFLLFFLGRFGLG